MRFCIFSAFSTKRDIYNYCFESKNGDFSKKDRVFTQIRLASAEEFFRSVRYQNGVSSYSFRLTDELIEENNGVFSIVVDDGNVSVFRLPAVARIRAAMDCNASELMTAFINGDYPFVKPSVLLEDEY